MVDDEEGDFRCPGCGRLWEDLPVGHSIPVGGIGTPPPGYKPECSDPTPVRPEDFMPSEEETDRWLTERA